MLRRVVTLKLTHGSELRTAFTIRFLIIETVLISETSVNFDVTTQRYIPEDSKLHCTDVHETCFAFHNTNQRPIFFRPVFPSVIPTW
jgi:hypothetical protein